MIDLLPTDEQRTVADAVATFLRDALPLSRFRGSPKADAGAERWGELSGLGAFGVGIPEAFGGVGLSILEDVLVFREFGRHLLSPAVLATRMAADVAAVGDRQLCEALLGGQLRAGLILSSAEEALIVDVAADSLAVLVTQEAVQVFGPASLVGATSLEGLDPTLSLRRARIDGRPLMESRDPAAVQSAVLLCAAMLCGLLEATRDMAVEYAKTRVQFGKPIGAFQAVKHRCADIGLAAQAAWAQTAYAALMVHARQPDAAFHAANAKMLAGEGALDGARANIQIHGGMGFTDEVDAHLLLKRAHVLHQLFIDPRAAPGLLLEMTLNI